MSSSAVRRFTTALGIAVGFWMTLVVTSPARAAIAIKDRHSSEPLVLDQPDDYLLQNVRITSVTDLSALTLTGRINSVTIDRCVFANIWSGINGKASAAEAQGAVVGSLLATDSRFEDAQHQLICLREGAFGTVSFQRCKFRTSESFLKRIYADDPWRKQPPTTEFANIDRLELIDNEYTNTILIVHPSVKMVVFRGDMTNVKLQSPSTTVIRLKPGQGPETIGPDGTAVASVIPELPPPPAMTAEQAEPPAAGALAKASPQPDSAAPLSEPIAVDVQPEKNIGALPAEFSNDPAGEFAEPLLQVPSLQP
jgi:hypothetical protein